MAKISVTTSSLEETNLFLRALWAQLRAAFEPCGWNHIPFRDGNQRQIDFGIVSLGDTTVEVGVFYKTRATLSSIYFGDPDDPASPSPTLLSRIKDAVAQAQQTFRTPKPYYFQCPLYVKPGYKFAAYESPITHLKQTAIDEVTLSVLGMGFDSIDAETEANRHIHTVVDVLTALTEVHFDFERIPYFPAPVSVEVSDLASTDGKIRQRQEKLKHNIDEWNQSPANEFSEEKWLTEGKTGDDFVRLSRAGWRLIERIVAGNANTDELRAYTNACAHFRVGRLFEGWLYASRPIHTPATNITELATIAYISALEVTATIGSASAEKCSQCGQPVYAISQRVYELIQQRLGQTTARLIKKIYTHRSKYLHEGQLLTNRGYAGRVIPQLDPDEETGCRPPISGVPILNLREFTGYVLRDVLSALHF